MAKRKLNTELKELLEKIPADKRAVAGRLCDELVFMHETLEDLKGKIKDTGTVEHFQQGKQDFMRESPALRSYNNMLKQYSSLYKQLTDLLPKEDTSQGVSELYNFCKE